jgi:hypothetical protein
MATWLYHDNTSQTWEAVNDSQRMEEEYQQEMKGQRSGQYRYQLGRDNNCQLFITVDFRVMETYCAHPVCWAQHGKLFQMITQLLNSNDIH